MLDPADGREIARLELPGKPAAVAVDPRGGVAYALAVEPAKLYAVSSEGVMLWTLDLPGGVFGLAVEPLHGRIYVGDWETAQILEIDPATRATTRRFPVGAAPSGLAVAADGARLVSADRDADQITVVDLHNGESFAVKVGSHPFGATLREGRAFVADVQSNTVSVVDLEERRLVASIPVGERPYAVAFAKGKGFVSNQYGESLTVFDAESLAPLDEIAVGEYPEGLAATADESRIWVANWFSDSLMAIDPESLTVVEELSMPSGPRAFGAFIGPRAAP